VFSLLFTPLGRYAIIGGLVIMTVLGVYMKIRSDAVAEIEAQATSDALRRTQDAIRAGDAVDTSPGGLLKSDGHRRD
jgi:hypothetical protein